MVRTVGRAFGILFTLTGIVLFFAAVSPEREIESENVGALRTPEMTSVLQNLIMNHTETQADFINPAGECDAN